jgi:hypothetical protein
MRASVCADPTRKNSPISGNCPGNYPKASAIISAYRHFQAERDVAHERAVEFTTEFSMCQPRQSSEIVGCDQSRPDRPNQSRVDAHRTLPTAPTQSDGTPSKSARIHLRQIDRGPAAIPFQSGNQCRSFTFGGYRPVDRISPFRLGASSSPRKQFPCWRTELDGARRLKARLRSVRRAPDLWPPKWTRRNPLLNDSGETI